MEFREKLEDPPSTLVSIACYAFPADAVQFGEYLADGNNPDEPGWFIQWLVDRREVHAFTFDGEWYDIGTPDSYLQAVAWALDGDTIVAESATVENADIGANVHVMADATVQDTSLDRSLVFPGATIEDSRLEDSIVDAEATVHNLDLSEALVGAHSRIDNKP